MTTTTTSSFLDNTSTAGFQHWGGELNGMLSTVGLVQTADTGQINWTTVAIPGAINTVAGYEIWRFADSTLYIKFEYGTGGATTTPAAFVTVGTGSNGAGTLSGQLSTRSTFLCQQTINSTTTNYTSYASFNGSALTLVWKVNGASNLYPYAYLCIGKSVDNTGSVSTTGFAVIRNDGGGAGTPSMQSVRIATTTSTQNDTVNFVVFPGNPTTSLAGANVQAYLCWMNITQVTPFAWACGYVQSEQIKFTPFSVSLVSTPSHTYIPVGQLGASSTLNGQSATLYSLAFIYE